MQYEMRWFHRIGSIEKGIELINRLHWNVSITQIGDQWFVKGGDKVMFSADSQEMVNVFLYGLALAYAVLPESVFEKLRDELEKWAT